MHQKYSQKGGNLDGCKKSDSDSLRIISLFLYKIICVSKILLTEALIDIHMILWQTGASCPKHVSLGTLLRRELVKNMRTTYANSLL